MALSSTVGSTPSAARRAASTAAVVGKSLLRDVAVCPQLPSAFWEAVR